MHTEFLWADAQELSRKLWACLPACQGSGWWRTPPVVALPPPARRLLTVPSVLCPYAGSLH